MTYIVFVSHDAQHNDRNPHLCGQTPCSHLSERKAGLVHIRKSALIPDYVIPLDVDEIWDDSLLFYRGLLLCSEMEEKVSQAQRILRLNKHPVCSHCRSHIYLLFRLNEV